MKPPSVVGNFRRLRKCAIDGRRVEAPHALPSTEAGATSNADTDDNADEDNASNGRLPYIA
ncbi:hypothetical protein DVH05_017102 [Phytophthora capsici]|nr:hypothetical protein DVH05_017102 [Phytophthora capsici]